MNRLSVLFLHFALILCLQGCLDRTIDNSAGRDVDLSGIVFDESMKPKFGVVVRLGSFTDTTGPDGCWALRGPYSDISNGNSVTAHHAKFRLSYSFLGEVFAQDSLSSLTQANLQKGIQEHSLQGKLILSPKVKIDSVIAWSSAAKAPSSFRSKLAYNIVDSTYSGEIFSEFLLSGQAGALQVWVNVMGNGNLKTGISDTVIAPASDQKAIQVPPFSVQNAIPDAQIIGPTNGFLGVERQFRVATSGNADSITSFEWNTSNTEVWQQGEAVRRIKWTVPGEYSLRVRLTDADSNKVVVSLPVTISKLPISFSGLPSDSSDTITPGIERNYSLNISDPNGVEKVIWSFDDGTPNDTTYGGPISAVHHKWRTLWGQTGQRLDVRCWMRVTVIDSFGNSSVIDRKYWYIDDIPQLFTQDLFGEPNSLLSIRPEFKDYGPIEKVEWSDDGDNFFIGSMDTSIRVAPNAGASKTIYHRITDAGGNASSVGKIRIFAQNSFTDQRDGEKYFFTKIGNQVWMTQNLRFNAPGSTPYSNNADSAMTHGRRYTYAQTLNLPDTCKTMNCHDQVDTNTTRQGVCPTGWHIPKKSEWDTLVAKTDSLTCLLASTGWMEPMYHIPVDGRNEYGFTLLPNSPNGYNVAFWPNDRLSGENGQDMRYDPETGEWKFLSPPVYRDRIANFVLLNGTGSSKFRYYLETSTFPVRCLQD